MYTINLGYDSVLINYIYSDHKKEPLRIFSIPGYDKGDYIHPGLKDYNTDEPYPSDNIFVYSKKEFENKFNVVFPITLNEHDNSIFDNNFINQSLGIQRGGDVNMLAKSMSEVQVVENTVDFFIENNIPFIYPYSVLNTNFLLDHDIPLPPERVIQAVKKQLCKIVFFYGHEGHVNSDYYVEKLGKFANFFKDNKIYFYSSNLIFHEIYSKLTEKDSEKFPPNLIFPEYCAFEIDPWFIQADRTNPHSKEYISMQYFQREYEHRTVKNFINPKELKKFLIFNRRPRIFRTLIHAAVKSFPELDKNCYVGIGKNPELIYSINYINGKQESIYRGAQIKDFILRNKDKYENDGFSMDTDLAINQAASIPFSLYYNSLISVVTETEIDSDSIFLSEKIFKPIVALHPFLILGNPFTLKKLKQYGYETFSKYWDESYDSETDDCERFNKVLRIIEDLNSKPVWELKEMYYDMAPILSHNYSNFINSQRYTSFLNQLCDFNTSLNLIKLI